MIDIDDTLMLTNLNFHHFISFPILNIYQVSCSAVCWCVPDRVDPAAVGARQIHEQNQTHALQEAEESPPG